MIVLPPASSISGIRLAAEVGGCSAQAELPGYILTTRAHPRHCFQVNALLLAVVCLFAT